MSRRNILYYNMKYCIRWFYIKEKPVFFMRLQRESCVRCQGAADPSSQLRGWAHIDLTCFPHRLDLGGNPKAWPVPWTVSKCPSIFLTDCHMYVSASPPGENVAVWSLLQSWGSVQSCQKHRLTWMQKEWTHQSFWGGEKKKAHFAVKIAHRLGLYEHGARIAYFHVTTETVGRLGPETNMSPDCCNCDTRSNNQINWFLYSKGVASQMC